ncbi:MAG: hypothetical protein WC343_11770 [Bacilli bacterium]|jgi:hypothetical protein
MIDTVPTPLGLHEDGSFRFHIPADLKKGPDGKTWIEGIASVEKRDITGETVILAGMDLSYLLSRGFFNDNHQKTTDAKVGVPTEATVTPAGLRVKGYLLDTPRAKGIVELAEALQKSDSHRKLGFSIEGKTTERNGQIVKQCWVKDIAITAEPVNPYTYLDIIKGISAVIDSNGFVEETPAIPQSDSTPLWDRVGQAIAQGLFKVFGGGCLPLEKMMEAGTGEPSGGGSALRAEDIEGGVVNLDVPADVVTKDQAVRLLIERGYSEDVARRVVEDIFDSDVQTFLANAGS